MTQRSATSLLAGLAIIVSGIALPTAVDAQESAVAFVDVSVLPMDRERVLEGQTVIVRDRRIVEIGPASTVSVPPDAVRINASGKFLMPGIAEMHGHLPLPNPNLPERWPHDVLFLYVANGITTVRGMQGRQPHLEMREQLEHGDLLGPRIYVASPSLSGGGSRAVQSPEDGARRVREYRSAGYDLLKIHEGLRPDVYRAIATTAIEVGMPFGGHVPDAVGVQGAIEAGQITVDHLDNMYDEVDGDDARIPELVQAMKQHNAWVVPTEVLWQTGILAPPNSTLLRAERTEIKYAPGRLVDGWSRSVDGRSPNPTASERIEFRRQLLKALNDADAGILLGTDSPQMFSVPGFSIHREMKTMVAAGMSPYDVLESGTRRVSEYFGTTESSGTVAAGMRADLILLNTNPLENIGNFADQAGVMVNGRWLDSKEIQERLEQINRAYSSTM